MIASGMIAAGGSIGGAGSGVAGEAFVSPSNSSRSKSADGCGCLMVNTVGVKLLFASVGAAIHRGLGGAAGAGGAEATEISATG